MSIISFDYYALPYVNNQKLLALYVPIIQVNISTHHTILAIEIKCVLDSGSDFNLFPAIVGEKLGINIMQGKKREHTGIGNNTIAAYEHTVKLFVHGYSFETKVHFSYKNKIPLLGRHSFFRFFKQVTFNEKALQVELTH